MKQKTYILTVAVIFLIIAFLHLLRLIFGGDVLIGAWIVPKWPSVVALVIAGYLGYEGLRLSRR